MTSPRSPRGRAHTLDYSESPLPAYTVPVDERRPDDGASALRAARSTPDGEDETERTSTGLGTEPRVTSGVYDVRLRRAEERWLALWEQGLVNLDAIPVLLGPPENASSEPSDALLAHLVARIQSGTTLRALLETAPSPAPDVVRAIGRLIHRQLVRLM